MTIGDVRDRSSMRLFEHVFRGSSVILEIDADTGDGAVRQCVTALAEKDMLDSRDIESVVVAVMKREELGSSGVGRGVAVPHSKHPCVDKVYLSLGFSRDGIDFNSLDGELVYTFWLVLSPPDRPGDHLRMIHAISQIIRDETFARFMRRVRSTDDVEALLEEALSGDF